MGSALRNARATRAARLVLLLAACEKPPPQAPPSGVPGVDDLALVLRSPDSDGWRHRHAVESLARTRDGRAVDVLRAVVEAEPGKHEFFLKRLAAHALGEIGGPRSAEVLAGNLALTEGALRLEEDCRAALVGIGPVAVPALSAVLRTGGEAAVAAVASLRAIGDPTAHAALRAARDTAPGPARRAIDEALAAGAGMWDKGAPDSGVNR